MLTTNSLKAAIKDESSISDSFSSNKTLTAATRKANNLFSQVHGQRNGHRVGHKYQVDPFLPREQRVSDSGNSSAGSIMSASSSENNQKRSHEIRVREYGAGEVEDEIGSNQTSEEMTSSTSTFTVNHAANGNEAKDQVEANSNATSLDLENVLEEEPSYQDMLHGNVRRMSNTVRTSILVIQN